MNRRKGIRLLIKSGLFVFIFLVAAASSCLAQADSLLLKRRLAWKNESSNKGQLYLYFGYNRAVFSKSDIHFTSHEYDISFYDLKASDRPTRFSLGNYFSPANFTVPQYNVRIGYFIGSRFHVSFGTDHMKYVVDQDQKAVVSGVISHEASGQYEGSYLEDTIVLSRDVLRFEHTNGLNFMSLDLEYLQPVANLYRNKIWLKWNFGMGGIWVVTKTDVRVFDDGINNDFHIAGYSLAGKTGPRFEFWKWVFFAYEIKAGYMTLPDVLIANSQPKHASHNFSFLEYYGVLGLQAPLATWLKKKK